MNFAADGSVSTKFTGASPPLPVPLAWHASPDPALFCQARLSGKARRGAVVTGKRSQLRVWVDPEKCQGHNRCRALAPELFEIDDLGFAHAKGDGTVPPELEDKALLAVRNCPEFAIKAEREKS
jgi:ferredoxin